MTANTLLDLRADVVVLLRSWGWTEGAHSEVLECHGVQWAVSNLTGDSQVTAANGAWSVPFDSAVPADVIGRACRAASGETPAAPDPRTAALSEALAAALAERTEDGLEADQDYDQGVFDVVRAITALVPAPSAPAPVRAQGSGHVELDWSFLHDEAGRLCARGECMVELLRTLAAAHRGAGHQQSAANLEGAADDLAASFDRVRRNNPRPVAP